MRWGQKSLFLSVLALVGGCSVGSEPLGRSGQEILSGTSDTTDTAIVAVDTMLPAGEELCSGYVITPDLVLTAQHCVSPINNPANGCMSTWQAPIDPSKLTVLTDAVLTATSKALAVAEVIIVPGSTGQSPCGTDLALLRLATPMSGVGPVPLDVTTPPTVGKTFTAIGYGDANPAQGDSGARRSRGGLKVASVGASKRTSDGEWIADVGPCAGDSGSPALDASGTSFGVMVRGSKALCQSMIYERLDVHADFLVHEAQASATRLGIAPPMWAAPSSGSGGAGGGAATSSSTSTGMHHSGPPAEQSGCSVTHGSEGGLPEISLAALASLIAILRVRSRSRRIQKP